MKSFRKYRCWNTLIFLLLLVSSGWWWYASRPKVFRVVAHFPLTNTVISAIRKSGILTSEESGFVLHGWPKGQPLWRVYPGIITFSPSDFPRHNTVKGSVGHLTRYCPFSLSTDGRYLALASPENGHWCLTLWHDGQQQWKITLTQRIRSFEHAYRTSLQVLDSGRVFIYGNDPETAKADFAAVIDNSRIIATGKLLDGEYVTVAPSGTAVASRGMIDDYGFTYASLVITGSSLRIAHAYTVLPSSRISAYRTNESLCMDRHGELLTEGGVYGPSGFHYKPDQMARFISFCDDFTIKPVVRGAINLPEGTNPLIYSQDGRFVLVNANLRYPSKVEKISTEMEKYGNKHLPYHSYQLYEYPGIKRAELPQNWGVFRFKGKYYDASESFKMLSPDGHSLAFFVRNCSSKSSELFYLQY